MNQTIHPAYVGTSTLFTAMRNKTIKRISGTISLMILCSLSAFSQLNEWQYIRPSNTGIGGDYNQVVNIDRFGIKWTTGYMPFWSEGSVARFDDSVWTNWSNFEGYIPADRVNAIEFDHTDRVWVGTDSGLAVYDGKTWTKYTKDNTSFTYFQVRSIAFDKDNNTWFTFGELAGGIRGGVAKFNGTTFTIYNTSNSGLPAGRFTELTIDKNNVLWIGGEGGLTKFDGVNWKVYTATNSGLSETSIKDIQIDSLNRMWVLEDAHLDMFDGSKWTHYSSANSPMTDFNYCLDVKGNTLIIGSLWSRAYILKNNIWTTYYAPYHIYDVRIDAKGNYWMCGIGFLIKFNGFTSVTYTRYNTGLPEYWMNDIYIDSKNRKWISNGNGGVDLFDKPKWKDYGPWNKGLFANPIPYTTIGAATVEDKFGDIWMAYHGVYGGVVQIPNGNVDDTTTWIKWESANAKVNLQFIECIGSDSSGNIWVGIDAGALVQKYTRSTGKWTTYNLTDIGLPGGSDTRVNSIQTDAAGRVWICDDGGIAVYDRGSWTTYSFLNSGLKGWGVYDVAFDSKGNKWIATDSGLFKFDGVNWTVYDKSNSGIIATHVAAVAVGTKDTIYAAAFNVTLWPYYGGLSVFDGKNRWENFAQGSSPIPHKQVQDVEIDKFGNVWLDCESMGIAIYHKGGIIEDSSSCIVPAQTLVTNITSTSARLNWTAVASATKYQLRYRAVNSSTITSVTVNTNSYLLTGLAPNTKYQWQVRTKCGQTFSPYTSLNSFKTATLLITNDEETNNTFAISDVNIYPNPARNFVTISFSASSQNAVSITVADMQGKMLLQKTLTTIRGTNNFTIDIKSFAKGTYILRLQNEGAIKVQRLIKY